MADGTAERSESTAQHDGDAKRCPDCRTRLEAGCIACSMDSCRHTFYCPECDYETYEIHPGGIGETMRLMGLAWPPRSAAPDAQEVEDDDAE